MRDLRAALLATCGLAVFGAGCGHSEKGVVDQYFTAVQHQDNQTLASFASVSFDKKVDSWKVKDTMEETTNPAPLPDLVKKMKEAEKGLADNTKAARAFNNDHYMELDRIKSLKKGAPIPAKLSAVAAEWDKYNQQDRELKKALASAKDAVEKEKRNVTLSLGQMDDVESLEGEVVTKKVMVSVTVAGQPQDYVMTLRKYNVKGETETGPRRGSRWAVQGLAPAG